MRAALSLHPRLRSAAPIVPITPPNPPTDLPQERFGHEMVYEAEVLPPESGGMMGGCVRRAGGGGVCLLCMICALPCCGDVEGVSTAKQGLRRMRSGWAEVAQIAAASLRHPHQCDPEALCR